jgi:hypothetical protein
VKAGLKALAMIFLASSCAVAWKITAESDRGTDFSRYKTFAIRFGELNTSRDVAQTQIETAIAKGLTTRGLLMVSGKSDLEVHYYFGTANKSKFVNLPDFKSMGRGSLGTHLENISYAEGTLVIVLFDPATQAVVWRVTAAEKKDDTREVDAKIEDLVRKAVETYPPKKK